MIAFPLRVPSTVLTNFNYPPFWEITQHYPTFTSPTHPHKPAWSSPSKMHGLHNDVCIGLPLPLPACKSTVVIYSLSCQSNDIKRPIRATYYVVSSASHNLWPMHQFIHPQATANPQHPSTISPQAAWKFRPSRHCSLPSSVFGQSPSMALLWHQAPCQWSVGAPLVSPRRTSITSSVMTLAQSRCQDVPGCARMCQGYLGMPPKPKRRPPKNRLSIFVNKPQLVVVDGWWGQS
jgi:hypothetical protein